MMQAALTKSALRQRARVRGYVMRKSRARESIDQLGAFMLIEANGNLIVLGERFDASLRDIEAYLRD